MNYKKLLFITSYFPPLGGPGVQRQLYYVKYAREMGWEPIVLTVKDVLYHTHDPSLLDKIPEGTQIVRTESLEFGRILWYLFKIKNHINKNAGKEGEQKSGLRDFSMGFGRTIRNWLTIIDDRILWMPFAVPKAIQLVKKQGIDIIVARGGPHSNTVLGYFISKITGKPLVLDLADPWLEYPYLVLPTVFHRKINEYFEREVFNHASKMAVSCPVVKDSILRKYKNIKFRDIDVVTNGFDKLEFDEVEKLVRYEPLVDNSKLTISHIGTLSWIRKEAFITICKALKMALEWDPSISKKIEFQLIGENSEEILAAIYDFGLTEITKTPGYVTHKEAIKSMMKANLLFLPISEELTNKNGIYVIPGKFFEYIGSGTPVLFIGPKKCDTAKIIEDENLGVVFEISQTEEIANYLSKVVNIKTRIKDKNLENIKKYERESVSGQFFRLLDDVKLPQ